jgi:hypothetical protein
MNGYQRFNHGEKLLGLSSNLETIRQKQKLALYGDD